MSTETDPQDEAQDAILKGIADTAKRTEEFTNQVNRAAVLKDLAEAYAWIVSPNNTH